MQRNLRNGTPLSYRAWLQAPVSSAPLAVFRMLFGALMFVALLRFWANGWIADFYISPRFHFPFFGLDWLRPLGSTGMYLLFAGMILAALNIALGLFYRVSAIFFFLAFTYVELLDKAFYLNHYYFISIVSFLLMLLPAHRRFSLDVRRKPALALARVPRWAVFALQLQLAIVYFFAGVAKLNTDWLLEALPLRIWLLPSQDLPLIGPLLGQVWVAYLLSWLGCLYDLSIPFLLWWKRSLPIAYATVVVFHVLTHLLFNIGVFPWVMILATLIFFSEAFHERVIAVLSKILGSAGRPHPKPPFGRKLRLSLPGEGVLKEGNTFKSPSPGKDKRSLRPKGGLGWGRFASAKAVPAILIAHFLLQTLLPLRFLTYPGHLFWSEEGFRFSWRVMLMEKAGMATFYVRDPQTGREGVAPHEHYLTPLQARQMAFQPDMLLQMAHFLKKEYQAQGIANPEIRVEAYVRLQDRPSALLVDPRLDLTKISDGIGPRTWVLPYGVPFEGRAYVGHKPLAAADFGASPQSFTLKKSAGEHSLNPEQTHP